MWLLSTARAELHCFTGSQDIPPYAILSHITDGEEESFSKLEKLKEKCRAKGRNPRDVVPQKINESCKLALERNLHWIWISPCCVDERSEVERNEAIHSLYSFYQNSAVCYVYLHDIRVNDPTDEQYIVDSKWNLESWTLQALVVPKVVVFVTRGWKVVGDKSKYAEMLSNVHYTPAKLLSHKVKVTDFSVSARMSWAKGRDSAQPEDRAYALLGLFGVRLQIDYGEGGPKAFRRLQMEIMKTSSDTTLFMWGDSAKVTNVLSDTPQWSTPTGSCPYHSEPSAYLLAPSPRSFDAIYASESVFTAAQDNPSLWVPGTDLPGYKQAIPTIVISPESPHMASAHVPVIDLTPDGRTILAFLHSRDPLKGQAGLVLYRCNKSSQNAYHCGSKKSSHGRLVFVMKEHLSERWRRMIQWKKINILLYHHA